MTDANGPADHTPPPPAYPTAPPAPAGTAPGAPIPGKTLGIVALIVAFFANFIGLILGIVALVQSRKAGVKNTPAVWAIIVGSVLFVLSIIIGIIVIVAITAAAGFATEAITACDAVDYVGTVIVQGIEVDCSTIES
ncbi:hypothetical protein [Microbacterium lacus]|uniref:hypothetical protein n=1 Tax=Microbacterium lacus TaxID=415217 RepID=UPI000C2C243A|nr:hypothetical protein [Microbacterium lacus]